MPQKKRSKQHQRITRGLQAIGACWAIRDQKFCGPNDPYTDQMAGRKTYHIHPDRSRPYQGDTLRFTSLHRIEEYIRNRKHTLAERNTGERCTCATPAPIFNEDGLIEWCCACGGLIRDHHLRKYNKPHPSL